MKQRLLTQATISDSPSSRRSHNQKLKIMPSKKESSKRMQSMNEIPANLSFYQTQEESVNKSQIGSIGRKNKSNINRPELHAPPPFILSYFGVPMDKKSSSYTLNDSQAGGVNAQSTKLPENKRQILQKTSTNSIISNNQEAIHQANNHQPYFSSDISQNQKNNGINPQIQKPSSGIEMTDVFRIVSQGLFNVWEEDNDPTLYYYPSIKSHTDIELLNHQMRRRKVLGLFLILNLLNLANLIIPNVNLPDPDITSSAAMRNHLNEGTVFSHHTNETHSYYNTDVEVIKGNETERDQVIGGQSLFWKIAGGTLKENNMEGTLVNLFCEMLIFCFSFYVCFCSQILSLSQANMKLTLTLCMAAQYILASLFCLFPNIFIFQFIVNLTVMFTLIVKEVITNKKLLWLLLANTFAVNYLAMQGLKYHQKQDPNANVLGDLIGYDEYSRAHIFGLIGVVMQVIQIQSLNRSLIRMLVNRINSMQRTLDIKDTYNASMIHELRNPLNAVLGSIGLLKYSKNLTKEDQETLNIAGVSGEILITLINNALDGAKLEANKLELDYHMNDVVEILTKSVSLFTWKAKQKKVSVSLKVAKNMPECVELDEARLAQVLVNLIGNAVKFTPESGNVKVRARFLGEDDEDQNSERDSFLGNIKENLIHQNSVVLSNQYFKNLRRSNFYDDDRDEEQDEYKDLEDRYFYNKDIGCGEVIQVSDDQITPDVTRRHSNQISSYNKGVPEYIIEATGGMDINQESNGDNLSATFLGSEMPNNTSPLQNQQQAAALEQSNRSFTSLYNNAASDSDDVDVNKFTYSLTATMDRDIKIKNSFTQWDKQSQLMTVQDQGIPSITIMGTQEDQYEENKDQNNYSHQKGQTMSFLKANHLLRPRQIISQNNSNMAVIEAQPQIPRVMTIDDFETLDTPKASGHHDSFQGTPKSKGTNQHLPIMHQKSLKRFSKSKFFKESSAGAQSSALGSTYNVTHQINTLGVLGMSDLENKAKNDSNELQYRDQSSENKNFPYQRKQSNMKVSSMSNYRKVKKEVKGTLMIEVIDSGIGISQEGIQKLFKPFSQADKSIQTKYGGTGLGLWITHKIINLMRGKISVLSELNKGTVFIIEIPVNSEVNSLVQDTQQKPDTLYTNINLDETPPSSNYEQSSKGDGRRVVIKQRNSNKIDEEDYDHINQGEEIKVLLYQHDEMMKNLFKKYLQKHKIYFNCATNFKDVLKIFKMREFRACFIDIDVNVKNEDLEKLVSVNEKYRNEDPPYKCKIYCFYSRDIDRTKTRFLQKNHIHCIKKPIQGYQLSKYIRRVKNQDFEQILMQKRGSFQGSQALSSAKNQQESSNQYPLSTQQTIHSAKSPVRGISQQNENKRFSLNDHEHFEKLLKLQSSDPSNLPFVGAAARNKVALAKSKFKQGGNSRSQTVDYSLNISNTNQAQHQQQQEQRQTPMIEEDEIIMKLENIQIKNKQIERIKQLEQNFSIGGYLDDSRKAYSNAGSSLDILCSRDSSFDELEKNQIDKEDDKVSTKSITSKQYLFRNKKKHFTLEVVSYNEGTEQSHGRSANGDIEQKADDDDEEEKQTVNLNLATPQFNQSQMTTSQQQSNNSVEICSPKGSKANRIGSRSQISFTYNDQLTPKSNVIVNNSFRKARNNSQSQNETGDSGSQSGELSYISPILDKRQLSQFKKRDSMLKKKRVKAGKTIMLVDDNTMNIMIIQKMLEVIPNAEQYRIIKAENGEIALNLYKIQEAPIQLILMDCEMPVMDGYQSSKSIREFEIQHLDIKPTHIVGLSGNQGIDFARRCKLSGMSETLCKPLPIDQLQKLVSKIFDEK